MMVRIRRQKLLGIIPELEAEKESKLSRSAPLQAQGLIEPDGVDISF